MTAKEASATARAKKLEADRSERMGSAWRQFVAACGYEELKGNFYAMSDADREPLKAQAKDAAKTLGIWRATVQPKG